MYPSCNPTLSGPEQVPWREWLVWVRGQHCRSTFKWHEGAIVIYRAVECETRARRFYSGEGKIVLGQAFRTALHSGKKTLLAVREDDGVVWSSDGARASPTPCHVCFLGFIFTALYSHFRLIQ